MQGVRSVRAASTSSGGSALTPWQAEVIRSGVATDYSGVGPRGFGSRTPKGTSAVAYTQEHSPTWFYHCFTALCVTQLKHCGLALMRLDHRFHKRRRHQNDIATPNPSASSCNPTPPRPQCQGRGRHHQSLGTFVSARQSAPGGEHVHRRQEGATDLPLKRALQRQTQAQAQATAAAAACNH